MTIKLKLQEFEKHQKDHNLTETECAKLMEVSFSQLWKVKKGIHDPGEEFIAGALKVFTEATFDDLFFLPGVLRGRDKAKQKPSAASKLPKTG